MLQNCFKYSNEHNWLLINYLENVWNCSYISWIKIGWTMHSSEVKSCWLDHNYSKRNSFWCGRKGERSLFLDSPSTVLSSSSLVYQLVSGRGRRVRWVGWTEVCTKQLQIESALGISSFEKSESVTRYPRKKYSFVQIATDAFLMRRQYRIETSISGGFYFFACRFPVAQISGTKNNRVHLADRRKKHPPQQIRLVHEGNRR